MACVRDSGTTANALHDDKIAPHAFVSSTCRVLIVMCIYGYVELLPPPLILTLTLTLIVQVEVVFSTVAHYC